MVLYFINPRTQASKGHVISLGVLCVYEYIMCVCVCIKMFSRNLIFHSASTGKHSSDSM